MENHSFPTEKRARSVQNPNDSYASGTKAYLKGTKPRGNVRFGNGASSYPAGDLREQIDVGDKIIQGRAVRDESLILQSPDNDGGVSMIFLCKCDNCFSAEIIGGDQF